MASLTFIADAFQPRYIIGFTLICQNNQVPRFPSFLVLIATRAAISESIANEVVLPSSSYSVYIFENLKKTAHVRKRLQVFTGVRPDFLLYR